MRTKLRITMIVTLSLLGLALSHAQPVAAAPAALFHVDVVAGIAPFEANFTYMGDTSQVDSYFWDFGDGITSTEQNPTHTYTGTSPARPRAKLTVTNEFGSSTVEVEMRVYPEGFVPSRTTYYIDATLGDDSNNGTSPTSAKKDLNAISHPNIGDTILFKRGEVWEDPDFGASLYLRESGIEGYPITYGAYGNESDPKPVIKRQAIVPGWNSPNNWTNLNFTEANSFDWGARQSSLDRGPLNSRSFIPANYLSQDGTKIKITVGGNLYYPVEIASAYIGEKATSGDIYDMEPGTITQITFGGSNSTIIYDGGTQDSDYVDYNFDHTKNYIISLGINSSAVGMYATGEWHEISYYRAGPGMVDDTGKADANDDYLLLNAFWNLVGFGIDNPSVTSNVWYMNASFQDPERVWLSGEEAGVVENRGRLNSQYSWMHKYYPEGNKLYIYSEGNPANTYSSMEIAGRYGSPLGLSNKDYMIFQNLDLQGGYRTAVSIHGGKNILIEDCNIGKDSGTHGLTVSRSDSGRFSNNGIIRNNNIDANNHVANYWHAETTDDGLSLGDGANNWTAYNNSIKGWAHTGIVIGTLDNNYKTTNNNVFNNFVTCPDIEYGRGFASYGEKNLFYNNEFHHNIIKDTKTRSQIQSTGIKFYNNIIDGVDSQIRIDAVQGVMVYRPTTENTTNLQIFNNIFANTDGAGIEFESNNVQGDYYDNIISNNIFYNTARMPYYSVWGAEGWVPTSDIQFVIEDMPTSVYNNVYQSNIFYKPTGNNLIYYGNDPANDYIKTLQEFNAMDGTQGEVIQNNIPDDPLFVNPNDPVGPDGIIFTDDDGFRLQSGSSAIDAGVDVGLPYLGSAPDIGAYEYVSVAFLYGDVSGDGEVSAYDAALTAQASVDLITLTPEQFSAADVDGSKDISAYDAALIAQRAVGLISKFPVE